MCAFDHDHLIAAELVCLPTLLAVGCAGTCKGGWTSWEKPTVSTSRWVEAWLQLETGVIRAVIQNTKWSAATESRQRRKLTCWLLYSVVQRHASAISTSQGLHTP